jgi:hypothetical protein
MDRLVNPRSVALIALILLVTLAVLAMTSVADDTRDDWRIRSPVQLNDTTIIVSGELTIEHIGSLHLDNCTLWFVGGDDGNRRIHIAGGSLVIQDTTISSTNGGLITVEGLMEVKGRSSIEHMDIWVGTRGSITMRDAIVALVGSYTSPSNNDPLEMKVSGSANFIDSTVKLEVAFISSTGTVTFTRSSVDSSHDFRWPYANPREHLGFDGGTVSMVDSTFTSLDGGIRSLADLSVRDCTFMAADLDLHTPTWLAGLSAWVDGCTFTNSDVRISVANAQHVTKEQNILIEDITIAGGILDLDLQEAYNGLE